MYEFKVEGMTCQGCVSSIAKAMQRLDAGSNVSADIDGKLVRVKSTKDLEEIKAVLENAGFPVLETRAFA